MMFRKLKFKTFVKSILFLYIILNTLFIIPTPARAAAFARPPSNLGLVGYWPFDEGQGYTAGDQSGNRSTGSINGASWTNGKHGKALSFSGAQSVTSNYDLSWNNTNSISISFWMKPDNVTDNNAGVMGKKYADWEWGFYQSGADLKLVYWDAAGGHSNGIMTTSTWGSILQPNKWVFVTYTWDGSTSRFYSNGSLVNTDVATNPSTNQNRTNSVMFGGNIYIWGDGYFKGAMDDIRFYSRKLADSEITTLYSSDQLTTKKVSEQGLVGYWAMNDGQGYKASDSSGNNLTGTITGGTWASGKRGGTLSFNGSSDKVMGSNITVGTNMTIAGWIKKNASTGQKSFFSNRTGAGAVYFGLSGTVGFLYDNLGSPSGITSSGNVRIGEWQHLAITSNGSLSTFYINGLTAGTSTQSRVASTGAYGIGWDPAIGSEYWDGMIDDVRVYNRALSATEMYNLYKQSEVKVNAPQNDKLTNGLVGLWSFNGKDVSGAIAYDRSGQGNNGTITGARVDAGKVGQGLKCSNNGDSVAFPDIASVANTGTYAFWIKPSSNDVAQGWIDSNFDIFQWSGNSLYFRAGNQTAVSIASWKADEWHHVAMKWDGTNYSGYIDGVQLFNNGIQSGSRTGSITICKVDSGFQYIGGIDEVRIYNRALSDSEIKQLYLMGR